MHRGVADHSAPLGPIAYLGRAPIEPSAASHRLGWIGLEAARYRESLDSDIDRPPPTHHTLILIERPPDELDLQYEGVDRHRPPPAGSVAIVPAGVPSRWPWRGLKDSLHVFPEPGRVERVASEMFGLDPARWVLPPLDRPDCPSSGPLCGRWMPS